MKRVLKCLLNQTVFSYGSFSQGSDNVPRESRMAKLDISWSHLPRVSDCLFFLDPNYWERSGVGKLFLSYLWWLILKHLIT